MDPQALMPWLTPRTLLDLGLQPRPPIYLLDNTPRTKSHSTENRDLVGDSAPLLHFLTSAPPNAKTPTLNPPEQRLLFIFQCTEKNSFYLDFIIFYKLLNVFLVLTFIIFKILYLKVLNNLKKLEVRLFFSCFYSCCSQLLLLL